MLGDEQDEGWEGCLSVPGMRGLVARFRRLRYQGFEVESAGTGRDAIAAVVAGMSGEQPVFEDPT